MSDSTTYFRYVFTTSTSSSTASACSLGSARGAEPKCSFPGQLIRSNYIAGLASDINRTCLYTTDRTHISFPGSNCDRIITRYCKSQDVTSLPSIAAQVVSGIGFLGAGVIMREGISARGLNTAATLWCAAAVGTLTGAGVEACRWSSG